MISEELKESLRINSCDDYFTARPQIDCIDRRRVFEAGFDRGARAIEAECRVPDGWQLVPMEPTAEQMEAVINRYCHYNDAVRDEYRTYNIERLRHDYIAAVAAAPKPEKAEPDCECGAVATVGRNAAATP